MATDELQKKSAKQLDPSEEEVFAELGITKVHKSLLSAPSKKAAKGRPEEDMCGEVDELIVKARKERLPKLQDWARRAKEIAAAAPDDKDIAHNADRIIATASVLHEGLDDEQLRKKLPVLEGTEREFQELET